MLKNQLEHNIKQLIKQKGGGISVAEFMHNVLCDEDYGYYQKKNPFGEEGDFITAPEASQIFGEIIGCYAVFKWQQLKKPKNFAIIELGAGNGTLLDDFLRATKYIPDFHQAINIKIVEISLRLQKIQLEKLQKYQIKIEHYKEFKQIKEQQSFIYANEFFDALPIEQYYYDGEKKWFLREIGLDEQEKFIFIAKKEIKKLKITEKKLKKGDILEKSPISSQIMKEIVEFCQKTESSGVFIDYGYIKQDYQDSLQALKKHQYHNVLKNLGEADITAHIDFENLVHIIQDNSSLAYNISTQKDFLINMGFLEREKILLATADKKQTRKINNAHKKLLGKAEMGELFKVLMVG